MSINFSLNSSYQQIECVTVNAFGVLHIKQSQTLCFPINNFTFSAQIKGALDDIHDKQSSGCQWRCPPLQLHVVFQPVQSSSGQLWWCLSGEWHTEPKPDAAELCSWPKRADCVSSGCQHLLQRLHHLPPRPRRGVLLLISDQLQRRPRGGPELCQDTGRTIECWGAVPHIWLFNLEVWTMERFRQIQLLHSSFFPIVAELNLQRKHLLVMQRTFYIKRSKKSNKRLTFSMKLWCECWKTFWKQNKIN